MAISVQCKCGKRMSVKDELAGRRGKCRECGEILTVPAQAPIAAAAFDEYETREPSPPPLPRRQSTEAGARPRPTGLQATFSQSPSLLGKAPKCSSCGRQLEAGAKICVSCGIDIKTGKPIIMREHVDENVLHGNVESATAVLSWILPIGLFPIASDAYGHHKPIAIRTIAILTALVSITFWILDANDRSVMGASSGLMLWSGSTPNIYLEMLGVTQGEFHWYQLVTNVFLHAGVMHLAGNLVFLLVFGDRINALLGPWKSAALYFLLAVMASGVHYISQLGEPMKPALGASGAIMGMAGMYFVLMPASRVYMVFWMRLGLFTGFNRYTKIFSLRGFWVLLFYIAFDVIATARGSHDGTAHWAHLGGFIGGMLIGGGLLLSRAVNVGGADLLTLLLGKSAWKLIGTPAQRAARG